MHRVLCFAAVAIAIFLVTPATYAQRSNLDLRFHAPFTFSVGSETFAVGDYQITRQGHLGLIFRDRENGIAKLVRVLPANSYKDGNGDARIVFHRYGDQYFLAFVSEGSLGSSFSAYPSKEETQVANANRQKPATTVSVFPRRGTLEAAFVSQE